MPQDLADLDQSGARAVHLGRGAVTQSVRAQLGHADAPAGAHHDMADRRRVHRAIGGTGVHEHVPALAAAAAALQVGGERLADVDGQRQPAVVRTIGLDDPGRWPGMDEVGEHFCAHRVFARLARENMVAEAIGFNYDCGTEAGLKAEGFLRGGGTRGLEWKDHLRVVADAEQAVEPEPLGTFTLYKAHGCAERYREVAAVDEPRAADAIVITHSQLLHWRSDLWMRDIFRERVRRNVLVLVGFSGQDPVIAGELQQVLDDVYKNSSADGTPRVVVIDFNPATVQLQ